MTTPDPEVGGAGMSSTAHPGTYGLWHAIRAIVAVHARYNRDKLLGAIDAELARYPEETPSQAGVTTVEAGARDATL